MGEFKSKVFETQSYWLDIARRGIVAESFRNFLERVMELMYIGPGQFLLEFLQNAEDALMEANRRGYFKIELYRDKIIVRHNGKPFDEKDIESLCATISKKRPALGYKGFIGMGWKSVYKVSNHVEVCSAGTCFEFNKEYWGRPEATEILKKYGLEPDKVLWQLTPIPVEPIEALPEGETKFIIHLNSEYLKSESQYDKIIKTVNEFGPSLFLFLDYINDVTIIDRFKGEGRGKRIMWNVAREDSTGDGTRIRRVTVRVIEDGSSSNYEFLVFKKEFQVPEDIRRDPLTEKAMRSDVTKREVAIAFEMDPWDNLKPIEELKFWLMYSFLPLTEVRTGLRFLIQADFIVHPGRRYINVEAKWNQWLMECLAKLLRDAITYVMKRYKKSYLPVFDYKEIGDEIWEKLIKPHIVGTIGDVLRDPTVICYKGHEIALSHAVKASDEIFELIKYGLLSEEDLKYVYHDEKHILDPGVKLASRPSIHTLTLKDLLNENLIKAKASENLKKALVFLHRVYDLALKKKEYMFYNFYNKCFVITSSGSIKLAGDTYIPELPQQITDLREKFPEIDGYLKSLDFVHEEMIKLLGTEYLKRLGVKEISLREVAEKVILSSIVVRSPPLEKERLLAATVLVKQALGSAKEHIWVLTRDGAISRSDDVWNPEIFRGFEDIAELLGIKLLDIDAYVKYDNDVSGWTKFFSTVVRGYELCRSRDYDELINKVKEIAGRASVDDNVRLIRFLKRVHDELQPNCWGKAELRIVTDEDSFADSGQVLLHDVYDPQEKWYQWKSKGFSIELFTSPKYVENPAKAPSWKEFFTKVLGVRASASDEIVGRFAEWFVETKFREMGYKISRVGDGYDFIVNIGKENIYVEVKGSRKSIREIDIELSEQETNNAIKHGNRYWLVVVENIPNNPRAWVLENPKEVRSRIKVSGKDIEKLSKHLEAVLSQILSKPNLL